MEISLDNTIFTRGGYNLEGWYTDKEYTEKVTSISSDIEVYAKWIEKTEIESGGSIKVGEVIYTESYEIWNKHQLENFRSKVSEGNDFSNSIVMQKADIDLNSKEWTPIGTESTPFKGTYDGEENIIKNIKINTTSNIQGLFGYIENATLQNIILGTGSITGGNKVGSGVGYAKNSTINNVKNNNTTVSSLSTVTYEESGTVINTYTYGTSTTTWISPMISVGGICGKAENTEIKNCINDASVIASSGLGVGGIVGYAVSSGETVNIVLCTNNGPVTGEVCSIGGIIGVVYDNVTVEQCTNNANVTSNGTDAGGIVGSNIGAYIKGNTNTETSNITAENGLVGGIVGRLHAKDDIVIVEGNTNKGTILAKGTTNLPAKNGGIEFDYTSAGAGGIVGTGIKCKIDNNRNEGTVNVSESLINPIAIGGIIGEIRNGTIENSYNSAPIGNSMKALSVGGIAGIAMYNCYINNSCNKGYVCGYEHAGGIVGWGTQADIRYCYNSGEIEGTIHIGGVVGGITPFETETDYTNNYIYYCYNAGPITADSATDPDLIGSICGNINYCDVNYIYSLTGTYTLTGTQDDQWGEIGAFRNATVQGVYDKDNLKSTVLSFGNYFKDDYTGNDSINSGLPILSWQ